MKLTINSGLFAKAMKIARKVMPGKSDMPAYNFAHLYQKDGDFYLRAQNQEECIDMRVPFTLTGGQFSEVALPIVDFSNMLSALPDQPLDLYFSEGGQLVEVTYENGKYSLPFGNVDNFPTPPELGNSSTMQIPTGVICGAMCTAMNYAADDPLRPVMNTVAVVIGEGKYSIVASDGHILFLDEYLGGLDNKTPMTALITPSAISLINLAIQYSNDEIVTMTTDGNRYRIVGGECILQARLVEGKYPNFSSVVPSNPTCSAKFEKRALLAALKRVSLMGNSNSRLIRFSFENGEATLNAEDIDFSTAATERLQPVELNGMPGRFEIGFKSDFLTTALNSLDSAVVQFFMIDSSRAAVLREVDGKKDKLALVMPMALN